MKQLDTIVNLAKLAAPVVAIGMQKQLQEAQKKVESLNQTKLQLEKKQLEQNT